MDPLAKITDSIYAQTDGKSIGNVGMIVTDSGNYLIDTSMYPVLGRDIRKQAESVGTGKVNGVFLTHVHFDHTGGMQHFKDVPSYAHKLLDHNFRDRYMGEEWKESVKERQDKEMFEGLDPTPPSRLFETNPFIPEDNDQIEMYHTGGHTNGTAFVYYRNDNIMFAGDNLFAGNFPWGGDPTSDPYEWHDAMVTIASYKPSIVIPGHGEVQHSLTEIDRTKEMIQKVIALGEKMAFENTDEETAMDTLMQIDYHEERWEGMRKNTLVQWYNVIKFKP